MSNCLNILLIEDDEVDTELIERFLTQACLECKCREGGDCEGCLAQNGYCVYKSSSLNEGMSLIVGNNIDVLLLDLGLPDVSGNQGLKKLRSLYPMIPVIVLTGLKETKIALASLREGAQDFLIKGEFNGRELQRCIHYAIERNLLKIKLEMTANELAHKSSILQSVIDYMGDGVMVVDSNGMPTMLNPAANQLLDVNWMETPPGEWASVKPLNKRQKRSKVDQYGFPFSAALAGEVVDQEEYLVMTDKHPEGKYVSVTIRSIADESSDIEGCVAVMHDITKRRKIEQMKDEFISVVSHELRTPLTSISGSLGLVLGGVSGEMSTGVREMLEVAERNSSRLIRLINDLLDIQKLESGNITLSTGVLNLQDLIRASLEANDGYAKKHNVRLSLVDKTLGDVFIQGDEDRLLQVMANLLSNAIKYSPEDETVTVTVNHNEKDGIIVLVSDKGPGIPDEFRDVIFDKFTQADSSTFRQKEGTGLGLSICKSILSLHGGDINFTTSPEQGTTFFFTLQALKGMESSVELQST